jgi:acyl-CoA thioesterase I
MIDNKVLLPEPEAPTIATVSLLSIEKSISRKISRVPVESVTLLNTCSTEIMESAMGLYLLNFRSRHFTASWLLVCALGLSALAGSAWAQAAKPAKPAAQSPVILVVGDSLSAEYGMKRGTGWVALLDKKLVDEKIKATVVNASISGDTTSGGRSRLPALLARHKPTHVIIELGGNDALRGLPLTMTSDNLGSMTQAAQNTHAKVLLVGMQLPPNYGADYSRQFANTFEKTAAAKKTGLVPFFLKGIADDADPLKLFQADRIHPKEEAHPIMLANLWPELKKLLK